MLVHNLMTLFFINVFNIINKFPTNFFLLRTFCIYDLQFNALLLKFHKLLILYCFQFRVESMMLRLAKNKNYVAVSPSIKQRAEMNAAQTIPLIMEPESKYKQLLSIYLFLFLT